jgi:hypothetical protein
MAARHQFGLLPQVVDGALSVPVGVEVGHDHEPIEVQQGVDQVAKSIGLLGRERARCVFGPGRGNSGNQRN